MKIKKKEKRKMVLYITWGVGFALCVLSILLIILFHKKDKKKLVPIIMYVLGFVLFMGSGFMHWKGIELKLPEKNTEDDTQQTDTNNLDGDEDDSVPSSTSPDDSSEPPSMENFESAIVDKIPQEYQSSKWFYLNCDSNLDNSIFVDLQIDQQSDDVDSALSLAAEYFTVAKGEVESFDSTLDLFSLTVVNNGSPVGVFSTTDGENFSFISDGKITELSISGDNTQVEPLNPDASQYSGTLGDYYVEIKDAIIATDRDGNPAIVVTYAWTNNSEETKRADLAVDEKAFQDGVELSRTFSIDNSVFDSEAYYKYIRPGATLDVQCAYELTSETSVIEFEISQQFVVSGDVVSKDFDPTQLD